MYADICFNIRETLSASHSGLSPHPHKRVLPHLSYCTVAPSYRNSFERHWQQISCISIVISFLIRYTNIESLPSFLSRFQRCGHGFKNRGGGTKGNKHPAPSTKIFLGVLPLLTCAPSFGDHTGHGYLWEFGKVGGHRFKRLL